MSDLKEANIGDVIYGSSGCGIILHINTYDVLALMEDGYWTLGKPCRYKTIGKVDIRLIKHILNYKEEYFDSSI